MTENFDHNSCFLRIGSFTHEHFSVLGFTSRSFSFNRDYCFTVTFRYRSPIPTHIFQQALYRPARLQWGEDYLHGVVSKIGEGRVEISSPLFLLNQQKHCRVYADKNFQDLMTTVLENYGWKNKIDFEFLLNTAYPCSKYIAQYHETDLEFIQRQCSRWGICFGFIQYSDRATLIFSDDSREFSSRLSELNIPFETFSQYKLTRKILAKSVLINDYNPETPDVSLKMQAESSEWGKSCVLGLGCDERPYEFYQTRELGEVILKRRLDYYDAQREMIFAETDNLSIQLGQHTKTKHDLIVLEINYHVDILTNKKHVKIKLGQREKLFRPELPNLFQMPDVTAHIISEHVDQSGCYFISPDYDANHTENTYPVRLVQPCTGNNTGFHFPLIKHTQVFITHINGDPDRPVILGVMPDCKTPVTETNKTQQVLITTQGHQWLMDDDVNNSSLRFNTPNNKACVNMLSDEINFQTEQNILLHAHNISQHSQNAMQNIMGEGEIHVGQNYTVEANNLYLSSGKDLAFQAEQICFASPETNNGSIELTSKKIINIQSENLNLKSHQKIIFCVGRSSVIITPSGITMNAASVNFRGAVSSPPAQLGSPTEGFATSTQTTCFSLNYHYLDNDFVSYILSKDKNIVWSGVVRDKNHFKAIDVSQKLTVSHSGIDVIGVDGKAQKPAEKFEFQPVPKKNHNITALKKPLYKTVSQTDKNFVCELLSASELDYLKKNNNNSVIVFIHGYDVPAGQFGKYLYIRTPQEGFPDDSVNGSGAHNWLLHMEYNLNCAAYNCYPEFDWEKQALNYRRIVGVHWPGYKKILDIPYTNYLNFAGMELNALESGYAVVSLIKQLHQAGLKIKLIAHSLGCLVALQLLELLGREQQCAIDYVVLWDAAVSRTALSPKPVHGMEQKRNGISRIINTDIETFGLPHVKLHSFYGEYLRQKAARFRHIPPWELYEKDPFAYFPYAHLAVQKLHVLYSHHDLVLWGAYRANAFVYDSPHIDPMGLYGPDEETQKLLKQKLICTDQQDWLLSHSAMKIPIPTLFEHIYRLIIKEMWI